MRTRSYVACYLIADTWPICILTNCRLMITFAEGIVTPFHDSFTRSSRRDTRRDYVAACINWTNNAGKHVSREQYFRGKFYRVLISLIELLTVDQSKYT